MLIGNDPVELRALGARLVAGSGQLERAGSILSGQLHHSTWCGADAEHTRHTWTTAHLRILLLAAEALRTAGEQLAGQAAEQTDASSAHGGALTGPGGGWYGPGGGAGGGGGAFGERDGSLDLGELFETAQWAAGGIVHALDSVRELSHLLSDSIPVAGRIADNLSWTFKFGSRALEFLPGLSVAFDTMDIISGFRDGDSLKVGLGALGIGLTAAGAIAVAAGASPVIIGGLAIAGIGVGVAQFIHTAPPFIAETVVPFMGDLGSTAFSAVQQIPDVIGGAANAVGDFAGDVADGVGQAIDGLGDFAGDALGVATNLIPKFSMPSFGF